MNYSANFSKDGKHRFWLMRTWDDKPKMAAIIGLNPSTADESNNDPTIQSCIRIAMNAGFGGFVMLNLYSFITSSPLVLKSNMDDAIRPETENHITHLLNRTHTAICAWGSWDFTKERADQVKASIVNPMCLGINKDGSPKHPLYMKGNTPLIPFL